MFPASERAPPIEALTCPSRSSKCGTSERLKNHSGFGSAFAELTQLQTFAKQKMILAKQKFF
jgi:hypothetical protein